MLNVAAKRTGYFFAGMDHPAAAPFQLGVGHTVVTVGRGNVVRPVVGTTSDDRCEVHVVFLVDRKTSTMLNSRARAGLIQVSGAGHTGWRDAASCQPG
ncbi:hypothetical protein ACTORR_02450 [Pseudomonas sp. SAR267]|uniref:hypothetical protein n=1 Tax=unclassified Pseudomonas TaxID=196821 RepID=UPI0012E1E35A|nr:MULTISPECIES: hypothetical protein [unclassified Pseudomonas]